ncbi:glutamate racemase [Carboxydochorda subterranea]|uniref:Glutamate racemase n=1 Tax=Carboxydichorda subterranea TaxID=3109565 RepID=A0ABZ1C4F4_9FIRM|nr:glutamate racemase [Limnochorda sp. L945t]WRP18907.1 glutamate racemase [Limnochorda sp. L945t]
MYDSGVGGLSVLRHLWRLLPRETVLYVADSGRAPYGGRPPEEIVAFGVQIATFLRGEGAQVLVVACNTSSSVALPEVARAFGGPVVGMLEPAARAVAERWPRGGSVAVLATATTVASGAYPRAIAGQAPAVDVVQEACPEWVPLVEAGRLDGPGVDEAVARHVAPLLEPPGVDGLVLGCTHYPFLEPVIRRVMGRLGRSGETPALLDPGLAVAEEAARVAAAFVTRRPEDRGGRLPAHEDEPCTKGSSGPCGVDRFFTSGSPERFAELFQRLVGAAHEACGREWGGVQVVRW